MKTGFMFIFGMFIAVFILLSIDLKSLSTHTNSNQSLELGQVIIKKPELKKVDKFFISMARSIINTDVVGNDVDFDLNNKEESIYVNSIY